MPCPGPRHGFTLLIMPMTFVLSLTQMLVLLHLCLILSILIYIVVWAAAQFSCAWLLSVQVPASYIVAGCTDEFYVCLFRQMTKLLLKKLGVWPLPSSMTRICIVSRCPSYVVVLPHVAFNMTTTITFFLSNVHPCCREPLE